MKIYENKMKKPGVPWKCSLSFCEMPSKQRSHSDSRPLICCCCGNKGKGNITLTPGCPQLLLVEGYVNSNYDVNLLSNPTGLCSNCKVNLYKLKKGEIIPDTTQHNWIINTARLQLLPRFKGKWVLS